MNDNDDSTLTIVGVALCCAVGAVLWAAIMFAAHAAFAQQRVPCRPVPNGMAFTILCDNGYFHSTMPDGTVVEGNGMSDPSATNPGSTIPMDDRGNIITRGAVQGPPPNQTNAAPGQWYYYGGRPPE